MNGYESVFRNLEDLGYRGLKPPAASPPPRAHTFLTLRDRREMCKP